MPNWCTCKLTILGPAADVAALVEKARGGTQHYAMSRFDLVDVKRERERCEAKGKPYVPYHEKVIDFSFHRLVPIPDKIMKQEYDPAGYDAEAKLWGVKWGASETKLVWHKGERADYMFNTPWAPPGTFLETLSKKMPRLTFALSFGEEYPTRGRLLVRKGKFVEKIVQRPEGKNDYHKDPKYKLIEKNEDKAYAFSEKWRNKFLEEHEAWVRR